MSSLIRLDDVCKTYQSSSSTNIALKQVNFSIDVGELTAIVGKSGSGKSTLMNILGLLDNLTEGSYFFNGVNVSHLTDDEQSTIRNESIGFIFQSFYLLPRSTILENVALPLSYRHIPPNHANQLASNMLKKVGLTDFDTRYPHQLSGGQQQRVAIARALVGNPAIILADEPTGALDSQTSHDIMQLLLKLNSDDNCTILIITHDEHISQQCKRVLHIKDGELFT